jgi:hypothetical protein
MDGREDHRERGSPQEAAIKAGAGIRIRASGGMYLSPRFARVQGGKAHGPEIERDGAQEEMIVVNNLLGRAVLTTDSPLSHEGTPILRVEAEDIGGDFRAGDLVDTDAQGNPIRAGFIVALWALKPERTRREIHAARRFLRQWPEGPQV